MRPDEYLYSLERIYIFYFHSLKDPSLLLADSSNGRHSRAGGNLKVYGITISNLVGNDDF
ncbi:hypothetical protein QF042_002680 [Pedobacter sp. W3I1]|nr:hypothetical protein [Pedobacter sp. W3I1]